MRGAPGRLLLLLLALLAGTATSKRQHPHRLHQPRDLAAQDAGEAPHPYFSSRTTARIAIVNQVLFHLEVVGSVIGLLQGWSQTPLHVYLLPEITRDNYLGFIALLGNATNVEFREWHSYTSQSYDFVWFVSPEYHVSHVHEFVNATRPSSVLAMVHNGNTKVLSAIMDIGNMPVRPGSAAPTLHLVTLAPHVAKYVQGQAAGYSLEWLLPVKPFEPADVCHAPTDGATFDKCLHGFTVQGKIDATRRNYTRMWRQIEQATHKSNASKETERLSLSIIGRLRGKEVFGVPRVIDQYVKVTYSPPFPIFYDIVYHSYGLVPMLASHSYFEYKFSSTIITALITGVPLVVDEKLLRTYTFLDRAAVFEQLPGEEEVDTMMRVLRMSPQEVWDRRRAMADLAVRMNQRAAGLVAEWVAAAQAAQAAAAQS